MFKPAAVVAPVADALPCVRERLAFGLAAFKVSFGELELPAAEAEAEVGRELRVIEKEREGRKEVLTH